MAQTQISILLQKNLVPRSLFGFADKRSGYEINSKGNASKSLDSLRGRRLGFVALSLVHERS